MAEPLVLWALHDFEAEQPDEVSFKAGEQITVIEKDDEFSDGWYTGRNESGAQGLFPFAYTTTDKSLALQSKQASSHLHTGAEQQQQQTSLPQTASQRRSSIDTDSYSLAETDAADTKKSTAGGTPAEYVPPSGGRAALAASAQRNAAQESASEREAEARRKQLAQQQFEKEEQRQRALIEAAAVTNAAKAAASQRKQQDAAAAAALVSNSLTSLTNPVQRSGVVKSGSNSGMPRTAPVAGMNVSYESDDSEAEDENGFDISQLKHIHAPILGGSSSPADGTTPRLNGTHPSASTSANLQAAAAAAGAGSGNAPFASATPNPALTPTLASSGTPGFGAQLSSPAPISAPHAGSRLTPVRTLSHSSETADSLGNLPSATPSSQTGNKTGGSAVNTPIFSDPHEWSVDEVVEWGRSKGWDDATVLSKFREHEISGDVLMEMDVVILKEIDIVAYGKRLKVANAIKELKRNLRGAEEGNDSGAMTPQTPGGAPGTYSGQRTPANVQITPRHTSLGLPEETSEQLESPVFPPGQQPNPPLSANSTSSATGVFAQMQQQPGGPGFTGIGSGNALGSGITGSRASIVSAHSGNGVIGGGRNYGHSRVESADGRPRSAGGLSLTGSFGAGNSTGAGQWPRSGPLELGFGGPHARAATDQGGSTNGSVRNMMMLDGTTANNSTDGDSTLRSRDDANATGGNSTGSSGGFLSTLGRGSGSKEGKASSRLSKTSDGTASPTSPNLRVGRNIGVGERSSFFGLGPRTRKPAPKEIGEGGGAAGKGTLSRLGIGKHSDKANPSKDRAGSLADLKDRISLPTSSPNYEANNSSSRPGAGIGISGAGLGANGESPLLDSAPPQLSLGGGIDGGQTELLSSTENDKADLSTRPSGHMKKASVDSTSGAGPHWNGIGTGPMSPLSPGAAAGDGPGSAITSGPVMARIRPVDFEGWIKKKTERYGTWKPRYMALKGPDLVLLRDPTAEKIKGYVSMKGYKVIADENTNPGKYGFKILHEHEKPHYFSSDDPILVREWMKALMKSTIGRDHSFPVISSYNNPTISLKEAQRMNPPPRPPSPTSRARVQRANARTNTQTLSAKDASVLMGLSSPSLPGRM